MHRPPGATTNVSGCRQKEAGTGWRPKTVAVSAARPRRKLLLLLLLGAAAAGEAQKTGLAESMLPSIARVRV